MLHKASKPSKALLYNFTTRKFICKLEFPVQIPVAPASETKQHASNESITRANRAAENLVK